MESSQALQSSASGPIAGPSAAHPAPIMPQIHNKTANNGDINTAGRDFNVNVHNHYNSYPDKVDIGAVLSAIRNLRTIHQDIISKATPGTGAWLFKTDKFLIWVDLEGDIKILWGTGIPGAGKTVLASLVIQELEARAAVTQVQICVCYVFIRYSDSADLTVSNILEIIVKQTVERHPNCAALAEVAYARHVREKTQPTEAELLQLLRQFIDTTAATFYLLDALDEAPDRIQVELVRKLASLNVRLFITSRPLVTVQAQIPDTQCFPIIAQEGDLDLHIAQEMARSPNLATLLKRAGSSLRDEIASLVKSKCGGMFLHASLQLDALGECINTRDVRQTLEAFPERIEDVYVKTWERILAMKPNQASAAKALLVWVLTAEKPMTIKALKRAVAISPDTQQFEPDGLVPGKTLIVLCRGLVTLEEESKIVRLVHYTAKDTLQGLLHDSFPHPHSHLVTVCMSHLTECGFQNTTLRSEKDFKAALDEDPLLSYASNHWATHARQSLDSEEAKRRIENFVKESNAFPAYTHPRYRWDFAILGPFHVLALHNLPISLIPPHHIGNPNTVSQIKELHPLEIAIRHGNEVAATSLLAHPEIQGPTNPSALFLVLEEGQERMAELLLAHPKIQVNLVDREGSSVLMVAARKGYQGIVQLLLARADIQVNPVNCQGKSALVLAVEECHEAIVKLLLARPEIQINLVVKYGSSVLMKAVKRGQEGIVKPLFACPEIQVNLVDKFYGSSAFLRVPGSDHKGIVKLFLSYPNIQIKYGSSALMMAAGMGHRDIVELLLARPEIQINLVDKYYGLSALMKAAQNGHEGIVKLLLSRPEIQTNLVDKYGSSALMKSAGKDQKDIVKLFLALPEIQANLVDEGGSSALMTAAGMGHKDIVKLLLSHPDIQINLVNKYRSSALMTAAGRGQEGIVELLLARPEIQVNLVNKHGSSALMTAAGEGQEGIVKLLLARSEIQVNLVNNEQLSPLMVAAGKGCEGIVKCLLAHPEIKVNEANECGGLTALMRAAENGHQGVVDLLLAHPETLPVVNLVDNEGRSALILAILGGHEAIVGRLLAVPHIDTSASSAKDGHDAMSHALAKGHTGIVQLLEEFESRRVKPYSAQATHDDAMHPEYLASEEPVDEEARSGCDSEDYQTPEEWPIADDTMDGEASAAEDQHSDAKGEYDDWTQDEPLAPNRDAKRPRDDDEDGLESAVDDTDAPAPKRQRGAWVAEDP